MEQSDAPRAQALSNGRMAVVIAAGGGGTARLEELELTRWSSPGEAVAGALAFVREPASGLVWPAGLPADATPPDEYAVEMAGGSVGLRRVDGDVVTMVDVCVSPFDDVEVRRITVLNRGDAPVRLEVGTRAELVLRSGAWAPKSAPEIEELPAPGGLLATHAASPEDGDTAWLVHLLRGVAGTEAEAELPPQRVTDGAGAVFGLQREVRLQPGESARLLAVTGAAGSREDAEALAQRYGAGTLAESAFGAAAERARNLLADLRIPQGWGSRIPELTGRLLFGGGPMAAPAPAAVGALLSAGLDPAVPLVVACGGSPDPASAAIALVTYWRRQAVPVDLLVLAADAAEAELLRERSRAPAPRWAGRTVVVAPSDLPGEVAALARAAARLVFDAALIEVVGAS